MEKALSIVLLCVVAVLLVLSQVQEINAVTCNPVELSPCLDPIVKGSPPSTACCAKLKEQKPCLCDYIKDPVYAKYIDSPGTKNVASICGVPIPTC